MIKPFKEHLKDLILKTEQEIVDVTIKEWMYLLETLKPVYLGKQQAEENMGIYQKRKKFLEENIQVYKKYAKDHDIKI